jgi:hypothetical protein
MRVLGSRSWQIRLDRWSQAYDWALWFRAAERIDAPANGIVPGPLDISPLPARSTAPDADLATGWLAWWHAIVAMPAPVPPRPGAAFVPPDAGLHPPGFERLVPWPSLRDVVAGRWEEAHDWHSARKGAALAAGRHIPRHSRENEVVSRVERELRRRVAPFLLDLVALPVLDDEVRPVGGGRYLVPERVYDGPTWPDVLRDLVLRADAAAS